MFECWDKHAYERVKVYAVDFAHNTFLANRDNKFKWVPMNEFEPL